MKVREDKQRKMKCVYYLELSCCISRDALDQIGVDALMGQRFIRRVDWPFQTCHTLLGR